MESRLTLIERKRINGLLSKRALFKCECGNIKEMGYYTALKCVSCGCYKAERASTLNKSHGLKNHPLYNLWVNIKRRCLLPGFRGYENYGARGINICDEWKYDVVSFYNWAIANGWQRGLQIDRIDNNGNYSADNCRMVTPKVNSNNKRSNKFITYNNETLTISQWADKLNKNRKKIANRLRDGWSIERAFS